MATQFLKTVYSPYDAAFNKLYLINLLNNAGADTVKFKTLFEAEKACSPILRNIIKKLNNHEIDSLIQRIERQLSRFGHTRQGAN